MLRVLRITLMWLVALAVPVQGYAAVAMLGCGPGHHGGAATSVRAASADDHDHDAVALMPHPAAGIAPASAHSPHDSAAPARTHMLEAHSTPAKIGKGACPTCAACCVVAGLPAALPEFQPVPLVDCFVRSAPAGATSFLVDGPERPPRHFLS